MNYNTLKCQDVFRNRFIGDDETIPYSQYNRGKSIKDEIVSNEDLTSYKNSRKKDISSFYYKSLLSYSEGVAAVKRGNYSWATIKLYYSVYYGLRCSLLCRNIVMVRAQNYLYFLKLEKGAQYKRPRDPSDHGAAINIYSSLFKTTDFLCSNLIDEKISYDWMKQCREIVNYRDEIFHDPDVNDFWGNIVSDISKKGIKKTIQNYMEDKNNSCFSPETAVLAIPTYRIMQTAQEIKNEGVKPLTDSQKEWIKKVLNSSLDETILNNILL